LDSRRHEARLEDRFPIREEVRQRAIDGAALAFVRSEAPEVCDVLEPVIVNDSQHIRRSFDDHRFILQLAANITATITAVIIAFISLLLFP
jgi:hypothetical protein